MTRSSRTRRVETRLSCHRSASECFSGVPARVVVDNPKDVLIRTCHDDPEVQRTYGVNTGFVFDKSTGLEFDTIDTTELFWGTIVTSNIDFSEWGDAFPNRLLGAATTLDRRRHGAYRVILDGSSYRCPDPYHRREKNTMERRPKNTNYIPRPKPQNRHFQVAPLCRSWVA